MEEPTHICNLLLHQNEFKARFSVLRGCACWPEISLVARVQINISHVPASIA